jgi:protocatechuate 3,4-dioxygenase beta subunit
MLTATPTNASSGPLPSLARVVDTTKLGPTNALTAGLTMPPLPAPVEVSYNLVGIVSSSGAQMPVTNATCTFSADVSDPHAADGTTATYETSSMADALTGLVTLDLIPAESANRTYEVVVTPDPTQLFATTTTTVAVAPGGAGPSYGPDLLLRPRTQLSGRILGTDGKPLAGVMVVPAGSTVAAALAATPSTSSATPQQATASNEGRFSLRLDPGYWDIALVPPAGAMLPRMWLPQRNLNGDLDVGTVTMPAGVLVHGVVHDPSGAPLPHANVRIYTAESGNAGCGANDPQCLTPPRLRAESTSGSDGILAVILPSQPTQ